MNHSVTVAVTPRAAAKLIIANEIDLSVRWPFAQSRLVVDALRQMTIPELLNVIDNQLDITLDSNDIPQFGSIESIDRVPFEIAESGLGALNYVQLGYCLKKDINAKTEANIKFGENHGKGAVSLGLAVLCDGKFSNSCLCEGYCDIHDQKKRIDLLTILYFRIPIIQQILKYAAEGSYNGFDSMGFFSESTKKRRAQCIRRILHSLQDLNDNELNQRLFNIVWEI